MLMLDINKLILLQLLDSPVVVSQTPVHLTSASRECSTGIIGNYVLVLEFSKSRLGANVAWSNDGACQR